MVSRVGRWVAIAGVVMTLAALSGVARSQSNVKLYLATVARFAPVGGGSAEWRQEGGNAQRTGYIAVEPRTPWTFLWSWNANDSNGGATCTNGNPETGHCYSINRQANSVAGGGYIFAPAGAHGLYAIHDRTGKAAWHLTGTFHGSPAYADGYVYAGSADGKLYRVDAATGIAQTYDAGSPINRGILIADGAVFALTESGRVHKVDPATLTAQWVYDSGATAVNGVKRPIASRPVDIGGATGRPFPPASRRLYTHGATPPSPAGRTNLMLRSSPKTSCPCGDVPLSPATVVDP